MALLDAIANIFSGQSPTTTLYNGDTISWNAPQGSFLEPLANLARPISRTLNTFNQVLNNTDPQQAKPLGGYMGALNDIASNYGVPSSGAALEHLSKLAGAAPQYYAQPYASAMGSMVDPNRQLNTQIKQAQLQRIQDPLSDPAARLEYDMARQKIDLERQKQAQEIQQRDIMRQIIMGQSPSGINPSAPISVRNNNPLNMRPVGSVSGFQKYATPQEGIDAATRDLTAKITGNSPAMIARYGQNYTPNLNNLINTWAPPSENDTQGYIDFVSKKTGIDPNRPLSVMDIQNLLPAMAEMEGGKQSLQAFGLQPAASQTVQQPLQNIATPQPVAQEIPAPLQQLANFAIADPEKYGATYLQQLTDYQNKQAEKQVKQQEAEVKGRQAAVEGESVLRKEFEGLPDVKEFRNVEASYKRIQKAASEETGASDIALIFNYMKMLDPGSTVREGEFATAQNSGGIPAYVQALYNQAIDGQRLTPEQRINFVSQANNQYDGAKELFDDRASQYKQIASEYGYKPERIIQGARKQEKIKKNQVNTVFSTIGEAEAANLPKGTQITIGGRKAVVE